MDRTDLTGFSALLGESLTARVELLERLLRGSHYPSLGQYKERVLAETIRGYLPTSVQVGTGFVLFPHNNSSNLAKSEFFDPLNQSAYSISRQCDVLVYDVSQIPPVFRDGDFVVVRPEAVRAVIEVKGSLSIPQLDDALASFHDFGTKWRATQLFYRERSQRRTPKPGLYIMAWKIRNNSNGRPLTTPGKVRERIARFYMAHMTHENLAGYPYLSRLFIHNECDISEIHDFSDIDNYSFGWRSFDGRFTRIDSEGRPFRDKDRTIAALLASLHWHAGSQHFNRFFSYTDEVKGREVIPYEHAGYTPLWESIPAEVGRRFADDAL
ncbi:DUF6602 domain-containing protein [Micromonospora inaquosa]|uniref:DUF6602 domain-containing protein n=1 Tax=Micromonospora inaquosa TaxID=2203716 RepID=UPI000F5FD8B3|nr:DUF6602 domain-containing protein [Micromonospora inaquosa]